MDHTGKCLKYIYSETFKKQRVQEFLDGIREIVSNPHQVWGSGFQDDSRKSVCKTYLLRNNWISMINHK